MTRGSRDRTRRRYAAFLLVALLLATALLVERFPGERSAGQPEPAAEEHSADGDAAVHEAYDERRSGIVLQAAGVVERVLPDDLRGDRHQRLVLRLASGHTLLISHNIDLAPRVPLSAGDTLQVRGQYEWNEQGGVIHWTHHDPRGRRPGGWIRHRESLYR